MPQLSMESILKRIRRPLGEAEEEFQASTWAVRVLSMRCSSTRLSSLFEPRISRKETERSRC